MSNIFACAKIINNELLVMCLYLPHSDNADISSEIYNCAFRVYCYLEIGYDK